MGAPRQRRPGNCLERLDDKRVYRIYCELELNLRSEPGNATGSSDHGERPRKRLKREKPEALAVPDAPNMTWSME